MNIDKKYIIIIISIILVVVFLCVFLLSKKIVDITPIRVNDKETDLKKETELKQETELFNNILKESETEDWYHSPNEAESEEMPNFQYYDVEPRPKMFFIDNKERSRVQSVYKEGLENVEKQQKKFLKDLYPEIKVILDEIYDLNDTIFDTIKEDPIENIENYDIKYVGIENYYRSEYIDCILDNLNGSYTTTPTFSVIDYFDNTKVVYLFGYKNYLEGNWIFVGDLKNKTYTTEYPEDVIKIGDSGNSLTILTDYYIYKKIGDFNVIFYKDMY